MYVYVTYHHLNHDAIHAQAVKTTDTTAVATIAIQVQMVPADTATPAVAAAANAATGQQYTAARTIPVIMAAPDTTNAAIFKHSPNVLQKLTWFAGQWIVMFVLGDRHP